MTKTIGKYLLAVGVVAALGLGALFLIQYLRNADDPEKQAQKYMEALEKAYREDQNGGNTPEETLQLFIDALKKGDTDLAAKYFIIDDQKENKEGLAKVKENGELNAMVKDLENADRGKDINEDSVIFVVANENNEVITVINIVKGPNGKWKMLDF